MISYAEEERCRRSDILSYFGETAPWESCGTCDVCSRSETDPAAGPSRLQGPAETMARMALSCLARMGNGHSASMVAKVLKGSASQSIRGTNFERLSTYGLLRDLTQDEIQEVLRALIRAGCLVETSVTRSIRGYERRYRVLNLSELGLRVMRRAEPDFEMVFPRVGALRPRSPRGRQMTRTIWNMLRFCGSRQAAAALSHGRRFI